MSAAVTATTPADLAEVEGIVRAAGTSFYRGMAVLPPDRRQAMYAIYAFCRIVDDIVDEPGPFEPKVPSLEAWRRKIADLYRGVASDALTRELLRAVQTFKLRQADFVAIIDGMQMDAEHVIIAPSLDELDLYCDRVAAAVGRLSVRAFGDCSPAADEVAWHLGRALQLTNILRDVHEDAERGRLYLPRELLEEEDVPAEPMTALRNPGLARVCARLAAVAHERFRDAMRGMERCDKRAMRPARLMGATYAAILSRMEERGWERLDLPPKVPTWQKLWILLRSYTA